MFEPEKVEIPEKVKNVVNCFGYKKYDGYRMFGCTYFQGSKD